MKIEQGKIEQGDKVFATMTLNDRTTVELKCEDVSGIDDVINKLRRLVRKYRGIASVCIRNVTQGWSLRRNVMLCNSLLHMKSVDELIAEGVCERSGQLLIQF